ncbi:MAG TPA: hypothetical protein VK437_14955 [Steroidobacteraceae bacterium]|nr:hypothetical protein [Steroidobacteraceae bacterium]
MSRPFGQMALEAFTDPQAFGPHFQPPDSWAAWRTVLKVIFGLALDAAEMDLFRACTGRMQSFASAPTELWALIGRRGGKSRAVAVIVVLLATLRDYRPYLAPGEKPVAMILAADKSQADVVFAYCRALLTETPMLAGMLVRETSEVLELSNGVAIEVHTSSYKSTRGRTLICAACDEVCFWRDDYSSNPADAVIRALRPALTTIPGALLLCASSTYMQAGIAYEQYAKHHGRDTSNVLIWKADTLTMNPSFSSQVVAAAYEADALDAAAEYGAGWLAHRRQHLPDELVDAALVPDRLSLARITGVQYVCFVDVSAGVSDRSALGIAHRDRASVVLDRIELVYPPFKPEEVVQRFADICSAYGVSEVTGDRFGGTWVSSMFEKFALAYRPSALTKSELYMATQPLFSQRSVEILSHATLAGELRRLERTPRAGGRDSVDHPRGPGQHDDAANVCCGALHLASQQMQWVEAVDDSQSLRRARPALTTYDPWTRGLGPPASERGPYG